MYVFFLFKQKTAYEMRISDWSSDVCSSDLTTVPPGTESRRRCRPPRYEAPLLAAAAPRPHAVGPFAHLLLDTGGRDEHRVVAQAQALGQVVAGGRRQDQAGRQPDRKSTRLNSSH